MVKGESERKELKKKNIRHGFHGLTRCFLEYHLCNLCVAEGDQCQKILFVKTDGD